MIGVDSGSMSRISANMHRSSRGLQNSVGRLLNSGKQLATLTDEGEGGGITMVSRLKSENLSKSNLASSMQNAVTYIQMQEAGLKKAHQIYERMSELASIAMDPLLSEVDRATLSIEFETLRQDSIAMNNDTFQGAFLYDDMAASVKEQVPFNEGLKESNPRNSEGLFQAGPKDVNFTSGKIVLNVNSGGAENRYMIKQGETMIFDTGDWATEGSGYQYDFDQFIVEFSPGKDTTYQFVPTDDAGSENTKTGATKSPNGQYDNKNDYLPQLGIGPSDGVESTKWNAGTNYDGYKFSGANGIVRSYQATGESTEITILVEGTTLYQANGYYEFADPSNYQTIGGNDKNAVSLNPVGLGQLHGYSIATANEARNAASNLAKEINGIADQMATLGANISQLEIAEERLNNQVYLSEAGISRLNSDVLTEESTEFAKQKILLESSQALMAQAFSLSENILKTLL